jgi:hypothetical protein
MKSLSLQNDLVQDAVIRNLEILGEASNNIQKHFPAFAAQHPELPLAFAYQMRNAVAHGYWECFFDGACRFRTRPMVKTAVARTSLPARRNQNG